MRVNDAMSHMHLMLWFADGGYCRHVLMMQNSPATPFLKIDDKDICDSVPACLMACSSRLRHTQDLALASAVR